MRAARVQVTAARAASALAVGAALLVAAVGSAFAQATPAGLWRSIDDETRQPKALIRIVDEGGVLTGRIEKILTDKPDARCELCTDERRDQPVQGMTILTGLKRGDDGWEGGRILDPNNGKVYRARLRLADEGRRLEVRGFVGTPLLGRTQTWIREQ